MNEFKMRVIKYVMEHYSTNKEDFTQTKKSLDDYWRKIDGLFEEGIILIKRLLGEYVNSNVVLLYLIENNRYMKETLGESAKHILSNIFGNDNLDSAYLQAGRYCVESGWHDRAKKILGEALKINPKNSDVKKILHKVPSF